MDFKKIAQKVMEIEANEILNACANLSGEIDAAVNAIYNLKGKLIVTGVGKSGLIGAKIAATLSSTGTSSFFLHPTEAMHGDLGMIGKDDGVLAISYSGESDELIKILPHIKRFNIPLIGLARSKTSSLGRSSDIFLPISVRKEACPLEAAPTSSTTLTLALGDALAVCLMQKRNFTKKDFASFHPGGSLGKRLFVKISDIMRTKFPIVSDTASLKYAIDEMTHGMIGNVILTDDKGRLSSILSDGDLRRALTREDFSVDAKAAEYATKNPKTVSDKNMLAADALAFLEQYKIQLLIIADEAGKPVGVLHIHDLIKAGISR
ncbi:MAG: KpsF/GutQ family sugar-phosphate isomerase [Campylobacteraceae bacterium]|jgi:arabinose-5-phosphate isomerase|nr:KpsF/GutQ family sugar-phosphate isomerase [Campylobacteraceae bacterium]